MLSSKIYVVIKLFIYDDKFNYDVIFTWQLSWPSQRTKKEANLVLNINLLLVIRRWVLQFWNMDQQ